MIVFSVFLISFSLGFLVGFFYYKLIILKMDKEINSLELRKWKQFAEMYREENIKLKRQLAQLTGRRK